MTKISHLCVFANMDASWVPCGQLSLTEDGADLVASTFEYDRGYPRRAKAFEIDPVSLSLVGKRRAAELEESPANSLAYFGAIRDATPDAWGRRVIEAKLGASLNNLPESQYLLHAGSDRVGALDVRCDASAPPLEGDDSWDSLPRLAKAAGLIERGLPVPQGLTNIFVRGAALGGARPKVSVRDERGTLHLAKLSSEGDRFDVPAIEYATLRLAEMAGLRVPAVRLERIEGRNVLLVRRFDRYWAVPGDTTPIGDSRFVRGVRTAGAMEKRTPFVSALTLSGCDEMESRTFSYSNLAVCMQRYCRRLFAYDGAAELFKRMIFNIFVSNNDDHLRNFGFLWDAEVRSWRLSPVYDLSPQPTIASERYQHLIIGKDGRLATLDNALSEREQFEISRLFACELVADVWQVVSKWRKTFEDLGIAPQEIEKVASAFRHIDDIASPALRHAVS